MYLVREVFNTKPGKAKELVKKFKMSAPLMEKQGMQGFRIMTDISGKYWTVVAEFQTEDLTAFAKEARSGRPDPEMEKIMSGYMDLLDGGYREIFLLE